MCILLSTIYKQIVCWNTVLKGKNYKLKFIIALFYFVNVTLSNINFAKNNIYIPIYLKNKTLCASILQIIIWLMMDFLLKI